MFHKTLRDTLPFELLNKFQNLYQRKIYLINSLKFFHEKDL